MQQANSNQNAYSAKILQKRKEQGLPGKNDRQNAATISPSKKSRGAQ